MPRGHCYLWKPALVWLQVLANGSIALASVAIFVTLVYWVRRIRDIRFRWMYVSCGVFILTCGIAHLFDVYVIWNPAYWLDGSVRAITAVASIGTAVLLPALVPKTVALAEAAALSHERGLRLDNADRELDVLRDISKLEAKKMTVDYVTTDVAELVRRVASTFDGIAAERGVRYRVDVPGTLVADIDPDKLHRILLNLLSNAFKFSPGGGTIRCQLEDDAMRGKFRIQIAVSDAPEGGALFTVELPIKAVAGVSPGARALNATPRPASDAPESGAGPILDTADAEPHV